MFHRPPPGIPVFFFGGDTNRKLRCTYRIPKSYRFVIIVCLSVSHRTRFRYRYPISNPACYFRRPAFSGRSRHALVLMYTRVNMQGAVLYVAVGVALLSPKRFPRTLLYRRATHYVCYMRCDVYCMTFLICKSF